MEIKTSVQIENRTPYKATNVMDLVEEILSEYVGQPVPMDRESLNGYLMRINGRIDCAIERYIPSACFRLLNWGVRFDELNNCLKWEFSDEYGSTAGPRCHNALCEAFRALSLEEGP